MIRRIFSRSVTFSLKHGIHPPVKRWRFLIGGPFYEKFNESSLGYSINGNRNTAGAISSPLMHNLCTTEKLANNYFSVIAFSAKSTRIKIPSKQNCHCQGLSLL